MLLHMRAVLGGTILADGNTIKKIDLKTPFTMSGGVYPAWHPGGRYIAFSVNNIHQVFLSEFNHYIEVIDYASDLIVYDCKLNMVTTSAPISTKFNENLPEWSPDGKFLYYTEGDTTDDVKRTRYSLKRIPFDVQSARFGNPEMLLAADSLNYSIGFPKLSPDNRFLVFCRADYGYFTINHRESDLWLWDISNQAIRKLDMNSPEAESYHTWSSNSRWLVFSSKRRDGFSAQPYFCHIDTAGVATKPFLLPQRDPRYYQWDYESFNRPEFVTGRVRIPVDQLKRAAFSPAAAVKFDPAVDVDALSGASWIAHKKTSRGDQTHWDQFPPKGSR
jgi:dipeptidyl aminopeptidase/acylaminoacyl peptidase